MDALFKKVISKMSEMPPQVDVGEEEEEVKTGEESEIVLETTEGTRGQQSRMTPQVPPPRLK